MILPPPAINVNSSQQWLSLVTSSILSFIEMLCRHSLASAPLDNHPPSDRLAWNCDSGATSLNHM